VRRHLRICVDFWGAEKAAEENQRAKVKIRKPSISRILILSACGELREA